MFFVSSSPSDPPSRSQQSSCVAPTRNRQADRNISSSFVILFMLHPFATDVGQTGQKAILSAETGFDWPTQRDVTPFHDIAVVMNLRQTNSLCISLFKAELHTFSPFKATAVCSINICYLVVQVTVKMIMIGAAVIF